MPRTPPPTFENLADLLKSLGKIEPARIRLQPPPGQATEKDLLRLHSKTERLFELVDGVLVEKVMDYLEGSLANWISFLLQSFLQQHDLGNLSGADGTMKLMPGLIRLPDLAFTRWDKFPVRGELPAAPLPELVPDLAVEVLSRKNARSEMLRKRKDYFLSGVRLVWLVHPRKRTVEVYTAPDEMQTFAEGSTLDGGAVLPGLQLAVSEIFRRVPRPTPPRQRQRKEP